MFRKSTFLTFRGASLLKSANLREKTLYLLTTVHIETLPKNSISFSRSFSVTPINHIVTNDVVEGGSSDFGRERRLKVLALEVDVCRQDGHRAPDPATIKPDQWEHILSLTTLSQRRKYYKFLFQNEMKRENDKIRKEKQREKRAIELEAMRARDLENDGHIRYHLGANSMFLRVYDSTIDKWHNHKLIRAMEFGQKLIIDCGYDQHMIPREANNAAKQLMLLFADNRLHEDPFDLHFCDVNLGGHTMQHLQKLVPTMLDKAFPLNVHTGSYLDLFPKEKLVYLTPHCRHDLLEFNHDDIYIVGAMVDKMNNEPLSLAKAKSQGLRMARLPLDHYLQWGSGSGKSLTINQMLSILLEIKRTGDWEKALVHVPRRKLSEFRSVEPMKQKLEKFRDYRFNFETWGAKKLVDHSQRRVDKRLKQKVRMSEVFDT